MVFISFFTIGGRNSFAESNVKYSKTVQDIMSSDQPNQASNSGRISIIIVSPDNSSRIVTAKSSELFGDVFEDNGLSIENYRSNGNNPIDARSMVGNTNIVVHEKNYESKSEIITMNYTTRTIENGDMFLGDQKVVQDGENGIAIKTTTKITTDKKETTNDTFTVAKAPSEKIINVGAKKATIDNLPKVWKAGDTGLKDVSKKVRAIIFSHFPDIKTIGGYRNCDGYGEHCTGRALDVMVDSHDSGESIKDWAIAQDKNDTLNVCWVIWEQQIWTKSEGWSKETMEDRGGRTANHFDHVHIFLADENGGCSATH